MLYPMSVAELSIQFFRFETAELLPQTHSP